MTRFMMPATTLTTLKKVAFTLFCCTVLMVFAAPAQTPQQIKADPGNNNPPPAGAILTLNGQTIPGGGDGTYQQYTVNFVAGIANTTITFAFRDDPAFISFANASVTDQTTPSGNRLVNGDFSGGTYMIGTNGPYPNGWTYENIYGATFGGIVQSGSGFCYTYPFCWYDGAVQAYDAISQTIATTVGHNYQISFFVAENSHCVRGGPPCYFSALSTNLNTTDTGGNGINVTVYAQEGLPGLVSQTNTLQPGVQSTYTFNNDKYKITPSSSSSGGESLTITAVPIPKSAFIPPANFPNETCVPFADYSTAADTCVGFQADCVGGSPPVPNGGDCTTLLYTLLESYELPADLPAIGGPDFLVVHGSGCPTSGTAVAQSIFTDYFVTTIDPTTKGVGGGTGSCFEVTYTPGAPLITGTGTTVSKSQFVGFQSPVSDTDVNIIKAGSTVPLKWQVFDASGSAITDLTYCASTSCTGNWVNLSLFPVACAVDSTPVTITDTTVTTNSGFQNLGGGSYQYNWKTVKTSVGCVNVRVTFSFGLVVTPAQLGFKYK